MQDNLCTVCYGDINSRFKIYNCHCKVKICNECLKDWVIQSYQDQQLITEVRIKCPNTKCIQKNTLANISGQFINLHKRISKNNQVLQETQRQFDEICEKSTQHYLRHQFDIKKCARGDCDYSGFVYTDQVCSDQLICDKCDFRWIDSEMADMTNGKVMHDYLTKFSKVMCTEPCPSCKMFIEKDGGCNSVICSKCKLQFCWQCLKPYPNYNHTDDKFPCGARLSMLGFTIFGLLVASYCKLLFISPFFLLCNQFVLEVISELFFAIMYLWSYCLHYALYQSFVHYLIYWARQKTEFQVFIKLFGLCLISAIILIAQLVFFYAFYQSKFEFQRRVTYFIKFIALVIATTYIVYYIYVFANSILKKTQNFRRRLWNIFNRQTTHQQQQYKAIEDHDNFRNIKKRNNKKRK